MIFIVVIIIMVIVAILSFTAGAGLAIDGELNFEPNRRIRKLKKTKSRIKELKDNCQIKELRDDYDCKIEEIERKIQAEIYSEVGIKVDDKE